MSGEGKKTKESPNDVSSLLKRLTDARAERGNWSLHFLSPTQLTPCTTLPTSKSPKQSVWPALLSLSRNLENGTKSEIKQIYFRIVNVSLLLFPILDAVLIGPKTAWLLGSQNR